MFNIANFVAHTVSVKHSLIEIRIYSLIVTLNVRSKSFTVL